MLCRAPHRALMGRYRALKKLYRALIRPGRGSIEKCYWGFSEVVFVTSQKSCFVMMSRATLRLYHLMRSFCLASEKFLFGFS